MNKERINQKKSKMIKIVVTDVDGVLTDGSMYYTKNGDYMRKFNTKDGMGVEILRNENIKTIFLSRERSLIVKKRAEKLNISKCYLGIKDKVSILPKICNEFNVELNEIAYIGDDVNDLDIMKEVGFSGCPNDGVMQIRKIADHICSSTGGNGVFREFVDIIMLSKKNNS
mgnify:CR=1 FL=1|tara:strand:+ start:76 stop:585 length:510 start_codon:yes stop_codon:yes gene_type:complete